jgi:arsenate reductase
VKLLRESGANFERVDYTKTPLTKTKLAELLKKAGLKPAQALRTKEAAYKKLRLDREGVKDADILAAMVKHPELIQRPIVEKGKRAVLARPVDALKSLL